MLTYRYRSCATIVGTTQYMRQLQGNFATPIKLNINDLKDISKLAEKHTFGQMC